MPPSSMISDRVWERYEAEIRSFYPPVKAHATRLTKVMKYMSSQHDLNASEQQWKRRLEKWNLTTKRDSKVKPRNPISNQLVIPYPEFQKRRGETATSPKIYSTQLATTFELPDEWWIHRFVAADFQHRLYNNPFAAAQRLFDHLQLPKQPFSRVNRHTTTMTEGLFLLQSLPHHFAWTNEDVLLQRYRVHVNLIWKRALTSVEEDFPTFIRVATFFLQLNYGSDSSGPCNLPIVTDILHDASEQFLGYDHSATKMLRSLYLTIMNGESPIRDITPFEWKHKTWAQMIDLLLPPNHEYTGMPLGYGYDQAPRTLSYNVSVHMRAEHTYRHSTQRGMFIDIEPLRIFKPTLPDRVRFASMSGSLPRCIDLITGISVLSKYLVRGRMQSRKVFAGDARGE